MRVESIFYWAVRIIAAFIMAQTLYFKFTGAEESIYIFSTVGMEPWGRIAVGLFELIASILILLNATAWVGAGIALGLMGGAIMMHLTILGIEVKDDGGRLFLYAVIVAICSIVILYFNKEKIVRLTRSLFAKTS
jgi:putative oxidoreductase